MVGKGNQKSPAAVAGMQIDYGKFRQMFFDQTKGKCGTNGDLACYVSKVEKTLKGIADLIL